MFFAIFGLSPALLAILAAVCSIRLGLCALHGQLLYFITLTLFSFYPLGPNSLWVIPAIACLMFGFGTIAAFFMVRKDLHIEEGRPRITATALLVLLNLAFVLMLMHNIFNIMCLRLDGNSGPEWAAELVFMAKVGSAGLLAWMLVLSLLGFRRLGQCAFYAICGLLLGAYLVMGAYAQPDGAFMPQSLSGLIAKKLTLAYSSLPPDSVFNPALYAIAPLAALLCAALGFNLLKKGRERKRAPKPAKTENPARKNAPQTVATAKNRQPARPRKPQPPQGKRTAGATGSYRRHSL